MKRLVTLVGDLQSVITEKDNKQYGDVWASTLSALVQQDNHVVFTSLEETFNYLKARPDFNYSIYYHNLTYNAPFIINYLYSNGYFSVPFNTKFADMKGKQFSCLISDDGNWYKITIKLGRQFVSIYDSKNLLPFSLSEIADGFKTSHKLISLSNKGRQKGIISEEEKNILGNNIQILREALFSFMQEGHKGMTIGSCCLREYKSIMGEDRFNKYFPNLSDINIGNESADSFIRESYLGGWCYVKEGCENKVFGNGLTIDATSLYPSQMHSSSGNYYPVGEPHEFTKKELSKMMETPLSEKYFFIKFTCGFDVKPNHLPFVRIKNNDIVYYGDKALSTSKIKGKRFFVTSDGEVRDTNELEFTMTCVDFKLFLEHYNVYDFKFIKGLWFNTEIGLFDEYIDKYASIKRVSKGAKRMLAKLFLNNLSGQFGKKPKDKVTATMRDNELGYKTKKIKSEKIKTVNIAVASAITSYGRNFTIRHAQENYDHFIYSDTDSLHCDCAEEDLINIDIHPTNLNCWKIEAYWNEAKFIRRKCYVERIYKEGDKEVLPYYNVVASGMGERCKELVAISLTCDSEQERLSYALTDRERNFLKDKRTVDDFAIGLSVPSKILPRTIKGGVVFEDFDFTIR